MSIEVGFDSDTFRKVMGHFVTGVTVVTTLEDGEPQGITVNALSSVSLEPPLVVVALDRRRYITPKVHAAGSFAVNVLGEHQEVLADCFAGAPVEPGRERFCAAAWKPGTSGMPLLEGAIATLECTVVGVHEIGDHDLFIGRVEALHNEEHHPQPLLYYRRHYLRVERSESIAIEGRQEG
jgi:flavin reductase (DIM6/NTAB) family NADH-FMN oxidoreductase RutF